MRIIQVAVLFLPGDRPEGYAVSAFAELWKADGISVQFLLGTGEYVPADVLFLHINLSVIPDSILEFARRYPKVINLHATDIRKRLFSSLIVSSDSSYSGPVIVKTDLNHGGGPEARFHPELRFRLICRWQMLRFRFLGPWREWRHSMYYPVYPSIQDVPKAHWRNPHWLVEKFLPERMDDHYVIRNYRFLGERENSLQLVSERPFIRDHALVRVNPIETEPLLRELRRRLKFDYGKFDYVLVDGEPVVLDINKTMGYTRGAAHNPEVIKARKYLAEGINDFLR